MNAKEVNARKEIDADGIGVIYIDGMIIPSLGATKVDVHAKEILAEMDTPRIILNLTGVSYLDSFCFGWIMRTFREIKDKGGDFGLCCPNEDIRYLLEITDFSRVVPVYNSENDAKEAVRTGNQSKRIVYI